MARKPTQEEMALLQQLADAFNGLKKIGWREANYAPERLLLEVIEVGSTGIHDARMDHDRHFWINGDDPSRPILFRKAQVSLRPVRGRAPTGGGRNP